MSLQLAFTVFLSVSWIMNTIGHLTTVPKNTVAKLGARVELECDTDANIPVRWNFSAVGSHNSVSIYHSGILTSRFKDMYGIDKNETVRYTLIMYSVDLYYSGIYTCSDTPGSGGVQQSTRSSSSAELIVIVADPVCNTDSSEVVVEGSYIQILCTVNYTGTWLPEIKCNKSNGQYIETNTSYCNRMPSVITQLTSDDNGVTFTCTMTFKLMSTTNNRSQKEVIQDNGVPDYHYSWSFAVHLTEVITVRPINQEIAILAADMTSMRGGGVQPVSTVKIAVIIGTSAVALMLCIFILIIIIFKTSKKGLTKPDIVPKSNQNSNGFRSEETRPSPVYASVIKKTRVGDTNNHTITKHTQQKQKIPVYEEVKKVENDEKIGLPGPSGKIQLPTETEHQRQRNYVGADGTQYLELDSLTELKSNGVTERKPQIFNLVETYASIDHSMKAPPPPPQLPRRHRY